ncbi:hypothetical protein LCGC14_0642260 [marine sediment metagenome]|uniref:Uncharacterized protein n=1 Tax=marine sediment metagenome TaxID=412755 RepID=A0A0F9R404_9ZZZZ
MKTKIDGSKKEQKKIVLNPGVDFREADMVYNKFIAEHWEQIKNKIKTYEYNQDYKALGCGYSIEGEHYFIYPTYISFVISKVDFKGFKEIEQ